MSKFKWRPNLFDLAVVLVGIVAVVVLYFVMFPQGSGGSASQTTTIQYTVELRGLLEGSHQYVQVGDQVNDSVKYTPVGTVVAISTHPATKSVVDEEGGVIREAELHGYEDIVLTIEVDALLANNKVATSDNYKFLVGNAMTLRTNSLTGSGYILSIDLPQ